MSLYPFPVTESDDTEKAISMIVSNENVVVMKNIKEATASDIVLQNSIRIMKQNDMESNKSRPGI